MKKTVCLLLVLTVFYSFSVFAKIPSEWAVTEVNNAVSAGYVPKDIQGEYTAPIKRSEFAELTVSFLRYELGFSHEEFNNIVDTLFENVRFSDTSDEFIILAARLGIVYGYGDGTFAPDKQITREEAASMLARVYSLYSIIYSYSDISYNDNNLISDWAFSDVQFCVAKGIMKGVSDICFDPKGTYTKEQSIITFSRLDADTDWENHNKNAKIRRKMSKELAEKELLGNSTIIRLLEKYETPFGTVYYTCTGGMMHAPGYGLFLIDDMGHTFNLIEPVPSGKVYRYVPELLNISFYPEKTHFSFEVSYDTELVYGNNEIHKAGTYFFEANLVTKQTTLLNFIPKDNKTLLEAGVNEYLEKAKVEKVIQRIDTDGYGVLLYVKTGISFPDDVDDRYFLVLIGNDGKSHLLPCGPVINRYGQLPQVLEITLSDYNSVVSYKYIYTKDNISSSSEVKEPGIYSYKVNLITLESERNFLKTE